MKKFAIGLIALLSVSLLFVLGCSTDVDEVEVETFTKVDTEDYLALKAGQSLNLDAKAKKSDWTGIVYITVTGQVDADPVSGFAESDSTSLPSGKWSQIVFDLSPLFITGKFYAIKNTNDAFRYYTGTGPGTTKNYNFITATKITAPVKRPPDEPNPDVYIPANPSEKAFKWKIYDNDGEYNSKASEFEVLVWDGADPSRITLEFREYDTYDIKSPFKSAGTIVIDYSAVTYGSSVVTQP